MAIGTYSPSGLTRRSFLSRETEVVNSRSKAFISYILYNASFFYFPSSPSFPFLSFPFRHPVRHVGHALTR